MSESRLVNDSGDDALDLLHQALLRPEADDLLEQIRLRAEEVVSRLEETDENDEVIERADPAAATAVLEALAEGLGYEADWIEPEEGPSPFFLEAQTQNEEVGRNLAELLDAVLGPARRRLEDLAELPELKADVWRHLLDEPDVEAMLAASPRLEWLVRRGITPTVILRAANAVGLEAWRAQQEGIIPGETALVLSREGELSAATGGGILSPDVLVEEISESAGVGPQAARALLHCIRELLKESPHLAWGHRAEMRDKLVLVPAPTMRDATMQQRFEHRPLLLTSSTSAERRPNTSAIDRIREAVAAPIAMRGVGRARSRELPEPSHHWLSNRMLVQTGAIAATSFIVIALWWTVFRIPSGEREFVVPVNRATLENGSGWIGTPAPIPRRGEVRFASMDRSDELLLVGHVTPSLNPRRRQVEFHLVGEGLRSESIRVRPNEIAEQAVRFLAAARQRIGRSSFEPLVISEVALQSVRTEPSEAQRLYAEGSNALYHFDVSRARQVLGRAVRADPSNPFAHLALSEASQELGYAAYAAAAATRAASLVEHIQDLPPEQRLLVNARSRSSQEEWDQAASLYESLRQLTPSRIEYALGEAASLMQAGRAREALELISQVTDSTSDQEADPRLKLAEAKAAFQLGEWEQQRTAAMQAVAEAQDAGTDLLIARARLLQGQADLVLEGADKASEALTEALGLFEDYGDRLGVAEVITWQGIEAHKAGEPEHAQKLLERAFALYDEVGSPRGTAYVQIRLGHLHSDRKRPDEARHLYESALATSRKVGDQRGISEALTSLGIFAWIEEGDLDQAQDWLTTAEEISSRIDDREGQAFALANLGGVYAARNEPLRAEEALRGALELREQTGNQSGIARSYRMLGEIYLEAGQLDQARTNLRKALDIQDNRKEEAEATHTRQLLKRLGEAEENGDSGAARHSAGEEAPAGA